LTLGSFSNPADTPAQRKQRGAFFTPQEIARFMTSWAIREAGDLVMEPSVGDAVFLTAAVARLREIALLPAAQPVVHGVEIHAESASVAIKRVLDAGGEAQLQQCDFFSLAPEPVYDAVIGNPPYIRYQDFSGLARARSREAALRGGIALSGLASSWAAFTVHATQFLRQGGRLAFVLPAELLSVNYARPVRKFLFEQFRTVQLVMFDEQLFPDADADVILLLADGYREGPAHHATIRRTRNAATLSSLGPGESWKPTDPEAKWTSSLVRPDVVGHISGLMEQGFYTTLETWGDTTLGMVTGNNKYFTLSPQRVEQLGLPPEELLRLSPPGSAHLRGLTLTKKILARLGEEGNAVYLFYPNDLPSKQALSYIAAGHSAGVDSAYKCRVRKTWYRVPLIPPADLLLTCMNADTPRLTTNEAGARHLNSVHGVYLNETSRKIGRDLLPIASLNSVSLLHAEMVGRAYGGGILKIEPREADVWAMPSIDLVTSASTALRKVKPRVTKLLSTGRLLDAVDMVDKILSQHCPALTVEHLESVQQARAELANRRRVRGASGR
jgi:adenine-specific DNA-methyltransferase